MHLNEIILGVAEIRDQCKYAEIAYLNILVKSTRGLQTSFSSIHSFLSHCAMASKCLWSKELVATNQENIATVLGIGASPIKEREFRDSLEHFDERLAKWAKKNREGFIILDKSIGPKTAISVGATEKTTGVPKSTTFRHFDPHLNTYTLFGRDLNLQDFYIEVIRIRKIANAWLKDNDRQQNVKAL